MNLEQYKAQRKALMDEAESLIEKGKANEANAKMEEVKKLDDKWEEVKIANANLNALKDTEVFVDLEKKSAKVKGERELEFSTKEARNVDEKKAYEKVWAKHMMGFALDQNERELFNKFNPDFQNAYTHDTTNTEVLIPETVAEGIWKRAEDNYPLYADARKYMCAVNLLLRSMCQLMQAMRHGIRKEHPLKTNRIRSANLYLMATSWQKQ